MQYIYISISIIFTYIQVAFAMVARLVGGVVSYFAVVQALGFAPLLSGLALASDSFTCAGLFAAVWPMRGLRMRLPDALAIAPETAMRSELGRELAEALADVKTSAAREWALPAPREALQALTYAAAVCALGTAFCAHFSIQNYVLPVVTLIGIIMATLLPGRAASLAPAGESLARVVTQLVLAAVGASLDLPAIARALPCMLPTLFVGSLVTIALRTVGAQFLSAVSRLSPWETLLVLNSNVGSARFRLRFALTVIFGVHFLTLLARSLHM